MTNKVSTRARPAEAPRSPGRRSSAQALRTRTRIIRSAERLFARKGYRGVSLRDLARQCDVRMFTIQHHFGSKLELYREIRQVRDREVEALVRGVVAGETSVTAIVGRVVDELFDYFLKNRDSIALRARAVLGEGLPRRGGIADESWVSFMSTMRRTRRIGAPGIDIRLLLITVEGILSNHALAVGHYQRLFGADVTSPEVAASTKAHLKRVILAILGNAGE